MDGICGACRGSVSIHAVGTVGVPVVLNCVEQPHKLIMALQPGTTLGPYEIQSPLGAGGMGEVYKPTDTRLDRTVAIKVLPEHLAESPERKAR